MRGRALERVLGALDGALLERRERAEGPPRELEPGRDRQLPRRGDLHGTQPEERDGGERGGVGATLGEAHYVRVDLLERLRERAREIGALLVGLALEVDRLLGELLAGLVHQQAEGVTHRFEDLLVLDT